MILIGSRALAIRCPGLMPPSRCLNDFDFVASTSEYEAWSERNKAFCTSNVLTQHGAKAHAVLNTGTHVEFELECEGTTTGELIRLVKADAKTQNSSLGLLPSPDVLFTLKKSHRYAKD